MVHYDRNNNSILSRIALITLVLILFAITSNYNSIQSDSSSSISNISFVNNISALQSILSQAPVIPANNLFNIQGFSFSHLISDNHSSRITFINKLAKEHLNVSYFNFLIIKPLINKALVQHLLPRSKTIDFLH